jgi:hypothetical protein
LDLAPSDFHLSGQLKKHLGGKRFTGDEEVETEVQKWLRQQSEDFCAAGFDALVKQQDKCIEVVEDMSRYKCFFKIRISHVLRFISICDSPSYKQHKTNTKIKCITLSPVKCLDSGEIPSED